MHLDAKLMADAVDVRVAVSGFIDDLARRFVNIASARGCTVKLARVRAVNRGLFSSPPPADLLLPGGLPAAEPAAVDGLK